MIAHLLDWRSMKDLLDLFVLVGPDSLSPLGGTRRRDIAIAVVRGDVRPLEGQDLPPILEADRDAVAQFSNRWRLATAWTFSKEAEAELHREEGANRVFTNGANNECTLGGIFVHAGPCEPEILNQPFDPAKHSHLIGGSDPDRVFGSRLKDAIKIVQAETHILLTQGQFDALVDLTFNRNKGLYHYHGTGRSLPVKDALDAGNYGGVPGAINQQAPGPKGVKDRHAAQANLFEQSTPHPAETQPADAPASGSGSP